MQAQIFVENGAIQWIIWNGFAICVRLVDSHICWTEQQEISKINITICNGIVKFISALNGSGTVFSLTKWSLCIFSSLDMWVFSSSLVCLFHSLDPLLFFFASTKTKTIFLYIEYNTSNIFFKSEKWKNKFKWILLLEWIDVFNETMRITIRYFVTMLNWIKGQQNESAFNKTEKKIEKRWWRRENKANKQKIVEKQKIFQ